MVSIKQTTIPHIYRNRFLRNAGGNLTVNSGGTVTSSGSGGSGSASGSLDTHYIWGQQFNGTQNVTGNMTGVGSISMSGSITGAQNITASGTVRAPYGYFDNLYASESLTDNGNLIVNGTTTLQTTYIKGDASISGMLNTTNINNSDTITTKNLEVTGLAHFFELVIDKISSVGGAIMLTPADGFECDGVEAITNGYRLWWRSEKDDKAISNMWKVNDQALVRNFNQATVGTSYNVSNKYYWSLVTAVGEASTFIYNDTSTKGNFIEISTTDCDGTVNPEQGDNVVMCGHRTDSATDCTERQAAIYISSYDSLDTGLKAPFFAHYKGINNFDLTSHRKSYFSALKSEFVGDFKVTSDDGSEQTVTEYIAGQIDNVGTGAPYIDPTTKTWWTWSSSEDSYTDTGIKAEGADGSRGADGSSAYSPTINPKTGNWILDGKDTSYSAIGDDGHSPYIDETTGRWFEWSTTRNEYIDTSIKAEGVDGSRGADGSNGISPTINALGNWVIEGKDTSYSAIGDDGHSPKVVNGVWYEWNTSANDYQSTGIQARGPQGADGSSAISYEMDITITSDNHNAEDSQRMIDWTGTAYMWTGGVRTTLSSPYVIGISGDNGVSYSESESQDFSDDIQYLTFALSKNGDFTGDSIVATKIIGLAGFDGNDGSRGADGSRGPQGADGENADYYRLYPLHESAIYDINGNLDVSLGYIIQHVVGNDIYSVNNVSSQDSVSEKKLFRLRFDYGNSSASGSFSDGTPTYYIGGTKTFDKNSNIYNIGVVLESYEEVEDSNTPSGVSPEIVDSSLTRRNILITSKPSVLFNIDSSLKSITSQVQDACLGATAAINKASKAEQTANGFETRVTKTETTLTGMLSNNYFGFSKGCVFDSMLDTIPAPNEYGFETCEGNGIYRISNLGFDGLGGKFTVSFDYRMSSADTIIAVDVCDVYAGAIHASNTRWQHCDLTTTSDVYQYNTEESTWNGFIDCSYAGSNAISTTNRLYVKNLQITHNDSSVDFSISLADNLGSVTKLVDVNSWSYSNQLTNDGTQDGFKVYSSDGITANRSNGAIVIDNTAEAAMIKKDGISVTAGKPYTMTFWAKTTATSGTTLRSYMYAGNNINECEGTYSIGVWDNDSTGEKHSSLTTTWKKFYLYWFPQYTGTYTIAPFVCLDGATPNVYLAGIEFYEGYLPDSTNESVVSKTTQSMIKQTAEIISLKVADTGIDIEDGTITLKGDKTVFTNASGSSTTMRVDSSGNLVSSGGASFNGRINATGGTFKTDSSISFLNIDVDNTTLELKGRDRLVNGAYSASIDSSIIDFFKVSTDIERSDSNGVQEYYSRIDMKSNQYGSGTYAGNVYPYNLTIYPTQGIAINWKDVYGTTHSCSFGPGGVLFDLDSLPTSASMCAKGQVYRDGTTLRICTS